MTSFLPAWKLIERVFIIPAKNKVKIDNFINKYKLDDVDSALYCYSVFSKEYLKRDVCLKKDKDSKESTFEEFYCELSEIVSILHSIEIDINLEHLLKEMTDCSYLFHLVEGANVKDDIYKEMKNLHFEIKTMVKNLEH